ncbi:hypothetical protein [Actinosynnema sp. NPDC020468]|uniref:hypothetical protein n=1 Tax=Actinosynnema sp. NPDC020468 TaxID=3154488 RepID=UPI0033E5CAE5
MRQRNTSEHLDTAEVRSAVRAVVEADDFDNWLLEIPEHVLIQLAAPLEMLQFQYYLTPPQPRHLIRAARVCCEAVDGDLDGCPPDMVAAFTNLIAVVLD